MLLVLFCRPVFCKHSGQCQGRWLAYNWVPLRKIFLYKYMVTYVYKISMALSTQQNGKTQDQNQVFVTPWPKQKFPGSQLSQEKSIGDGTALRRD